MYEAKVVNVLVASPSDVAAERRAVREAIHNWNAVNSQREGIVLMPIGWETHAMPEVGGHPQALLNRQLVDNADLVIAIFWTKLGTPTETAPSGTVEEIERHRAAGKPVMLYFSSAPVVPDSIDPEQYAGLKKYKKSMEGQSFYQTFDDTADFASKLGRQLSQAVIAHFDGLSKAGMEDGPQPESSINITRTDLGAEALELLREAAADRNGTVLRLRTMGGMSIQANTRMLNSPGDPRSEALWDNALKALVDADLLEPRGHKNEVFAVTHIGYRLVDQLNDSATS
jgi:hypothetical protein